LKLLRPRLRYAISLASLGLFLAIAPPCAHTEEVAVSKPAEQPLPDFRQKIKPILEQYFYDCHANGEKKGEVAFESMKTDDQLLHNPELWFKALRNVRSNIMPPEGNPRPDEAERALLAQWIKYKALHIDPADPNPGRVTLRWLNRIEYRNTVRELTGYDY